MINLMTIEGHRAVIQYDPEIEMIRGEFLGLNGGADFYADNIEDLKREGRNSLRVFLDECEMRGIEPTKSYSGKLNLRLDALMHERATEAAAAKGVSLNQFISDAVEHEMAD